MNRNIAFLVMGLGLFGISGQAQAQIVNQGSFAVSGQGRLCGLAREADTGTIWVYPCFGAAVLSYSATGEAAGSVPRPGEAADDVDVLVTPESFVLADSTLPANTLLFVNGESGVTEVYAIDKTTGAIIDTLVAGFGNDHVVGGAYHAERQTIFLVQDNVPAASVRNRIAEIDPVTGDTLQTFGIEADFSVSFGDLDVSGVTGNLFVVSSVESDIAEFTPDGDFVELHPLPSGVGTLSGIALDCAAQEAWVSSTNGTVFQLGEVPCGVPTAVETEQPTTHHIAVVFPNPFTTDATISLEVDRPQHARITVYDLLGRLVKVVHDGPVQAGEQPFTLSGASLPAGTYLVRLEGENFLYTQRVSRID